MKRVQWLKIVGLIVLAALLLALPPSLSRYYQGTLIQLLQVTVLAMGFRLIYSIGRFTLGHAAFVAMGAYTSALLSTNLGLSFWFGLIAGGIVAAIVAMVIGSIVLRVGGVYFVIITLAFAEFLRYFLLWAKGLTGGADGLWNIPGPSIGSFNFGMTPLPYYYLMLALALVSGLVMYRMERSRMGLTFHALRQNHLLAEHLGVHIARYRLLAFTAASFFAGMVGAFQGSLFHYVSPDDFTLHQSLYYQVYAMVGGILSFGGPIVGSVVVVGLSEYLRLAKEVQPLIFGVLLILIMLFLPKGLVSIPREIAAIMRRRTAMRSMAASANGDQTAAELTRSESVLAGSDRS